MTPARTDIRAQLIDIAEPVCASAGYELVDLRYQREQGGWVVRVFIDRAGEGEPIGFDDCEHVSRELSAVFDVEDPVPAAYNLEVSSPGVERPLRTVEHFRQAIGKQAKVALDVGIEGRRNFTGTIVEVDHQAQTVSMSVDGKTYELPHRDVGSARLVVDWDAVLRGNANSAKEQAG